ncbi:MAG: HlyD family efflux transporter periplasmic adaptor subunit, partial [Clostridia bacterium]|nr:HlyD family efflux transporter periplasmic adaptor subunit [Clostridia bacterium]
DSSYEKQELLNFEKLKELYKKEENKLANLISLIDNTDTESLPKQINQEFLDSKCVAFISEYKKYKNQTKLAKDNYERQKSLFPISISRTELEEYENTYLQTKYSFVSWLENQKIQSRENYTEITKNLQNCQIQIMQINKEISNSKVYAKSTGYINEINKIKVGDYLNAGTQILTIIPESKDLLCIASVPASNISKLKIGQEAIIQVNDLPWTKYGKLNGKVLLVPSDSLQVSANSSQNVFPVEITLSQIFLEDRNKNKIYLHIGSTASVRIKISNNTIFQKFLQSLIENK